MRYLWKGEVMSEGTITSPQTPVEYPEQSPTRSDKPIVIDVKPEGR